MPPKKQKRYQNISRVNTSVTRETAQGPKTITVRPAQVVQLTDADIEITKDSSQVREHNPFDRGWIVEIPAGASTHPDAPVLGKNPNLGEVARTLTEGGMDQFGEMLDKIQDRRGLVFCRRGLESVKEKIGDQLARQAEEMIDDRDTAIDKMLRANRTLV